jgi:hypothetical protein
VPQRLRRLPGEMQQLTADRFDVDNGGARDADLSRPRTRRENDAIGPWPMLTTLVSSAKVAPFFIAAVAIASAKSGTPTMPCVPIQSPPLASGVTSGSFFCSASRSSHRASVP